MHGYHRHLPRLKLHILITGNQALLPLLVLGEIYGQLVMTQVALALDRLLKEMISP